ncbi:MAG TPA: thiol protease/hemagglutinin PrtT [Candidatus Coprenecus stercoravium]|uniref:Thiol protease/hemagglutinin PrtT n=1 Tax=Candidatus Coprenecus stercoravium TaxID=2840735 RepID=A0A9D2GQ76_9BACT|nr:thiol protease/hemagglutinin PrtT [Candidatus Coprenecus stercoravium]
MRRDFIISALAMLLVSLTASAERVTRQQAAETAAEFFSRAETGGFSRNRVPSVTMVMSVEDAFYVFDNADGHGFVIVSAEDAVMPVLGYSFENSFPEDGDMAPGLRSWMEDMRKEIMAVRAMGISQSESTAAAWSGPEYGTPVVELETARWGQEEPFCDLCPVVDGQTAATGCAATALASVMYYFRWPEKGTGTIPAYTTLTDKRPVEALTLGHTYNWDNMLADYSSSYTEEQAGAVAVLMRDCGYMIESDYRARDNGGTGSYMKDIPEPLVKYMGYDESVRHVTRADYTAQEWLDMMKAELDGGRPVLYAGCTASYAAHAFVLDGYTDNDFFRVNWGWCGESNGYFLLDALNVERNGNLYELNYLQDAIIGIQPDTGTEDVSGEVGLAYDKAAGTVTLTAQEQITVSLIDSEGRMAAEAASGTSVTLDISGLEAGDYTLKVTGDTLSMELTLTV